MVTYIYWIAVFGMAAAMLLFLGFYVKEWKAAIISLVIILTVGVIAYYFHFQQIFVKRYGGIMTVTVPEGHLHLAAIWKDDNLWIENYDPITNSCHFLEYSRGNLLQGQVIIKECNPLLRQPLPVTAELPETAEKE